MNKNISLELRLGSKSGEKSATSNVSLYFSPVVATLLPVSVWPPGGEVRTDGTSPYVPYTLCTTVLTESTAQENGGGGFCCFIATAAGATATSVAGAGAAAQQSRFRTGEACVYLTGWPAAPQNFQKSPHLQRKGFQIRFVRPRISVH